MTSRLRDVRVRLSVEQADRFRNVLRDAGGAGQRALQQISRATAPASAGLLGVDRASQALAGGLRTIDGPLAGIAGRMTGFVASLGAVNPASAAAAAGAAALTAALTASVRAAERANVTQRQTAAVLRATGQASGQTAQQIEAAAQALGRETLASTQEVREAANQLLTFRNISGEAFGRTLRAAQDLASLGFGGLRQQTILLARALEDPAEGLQRLQRVGVSFNAVQEETIRNLQRSGDLAGAQAEIFRVLEQQIGGAAVAAADGLSGSLDTLNEEFNLLLENAGRGTAAIDVFGGAADLAAAALRRLNRAMAPTTFERLGDVSALIQGVEPGLDPLTNLGLRRQRELQAELSLELSAEMQDRRRAEARSRFQREQTQRQELRGQVAEIVGRAAPQAARLTRFDENLASIEQAFQTGAISAEEYARAVASVEAAIAKLQQRITGGGQVDRAGARNARVIADLERRGLAQIDPRAASIQQAVGRLAPGADEATVARVRELAAANFDQAEATRAKAAAEKELQQIQQEGVVFTESLATAEERYAAALVEANRLLELEAINQQTFNRALQRAEVDLQRATFGVDDLARSIDIGLNAALRGSIDSWQDLGQVALSVAADLANAFLRTQGIQASGGGIASTLFGFAQLALPFLIPGGQGAGVAAALGAAQAGAFNPGVGPGGLGFLHFGGPRQEGGPVWPGGAFLVGERRPELFVPDRPGTIMPIGNVTIIDRRGADAPPMSVERDESGLRIIVRDEIARRTPEIVNAAVAETRRVSQINSTFFGTRRR